jgi:hypothetical protein
VACNSLRRDGAACAGSGTAVDFLVIKILLTMHECGLASAIFRRKNRVFLGAMLDL